MYERFFRLAAFAVTLVCPAIAQVAILQIQFIEGDGAVHAPGSRSARPLTVEVTDETGQPGAGRGGQFPSARGRARAARSPTGCAPRSRVTDAQGRVALHGLQVNRVARAVPDPGDRE